MIKKNTKRTKEDILYRILLICFAIFLTYFTIGKFLPKASTRVLYNMIIVSIILVPVWYIIFNKLRLTYSKILNYFILKLKGKNKIKDFKRILLNWLPSGFILALVSIILFSFFSYYIILDMKMWDPTVDYVDIATNLHSVVFPIAIAISLILIIIFQVMYLIRKENIRKKVAIFSTLFSLIIFIIIIYLIRYIILAVLSYF